MTKMKQKARMSRMILPYFSHDTKPQRRRFIVVACFFSSIFSCLRFSYSFFLCSHSFATSQLIWFSFFSESKSKLKKFFRNFNAYFDVCVVCIYVDFFPLTLTLFCFIASNSINLIPMLCVLFFYSICLKVNKNFWSETSTYIFIKKKMRNKEKER